MEARIIITRDNGKNVGIKCECPDNLVIMENMLSVMTIAIMDKLYETDSGAANDLKKLNITATEMEF